MIVLRHYMYYILSPTEGLSQFEEAVREHNGHGVSAAGDASTSNAHAHV